MVSVPWREERRATHVLAGWLPRWIRGSTGLMLGGLLGLRIHPGDRLGAGRRGPARWRCGRSTSPRGSSRGGTADADGHEVPGWYLLASVLFMLAAIVLTGTFIAGVVQWLQSTRTVGLIGQHPARHDHVVVAGLGQMGYRTYLLLRELELPVVALERNPAAPVHPPRPGREIPVLLGRRGPGGAGEQVGLARAYLPGRPRVDDLDNVEIADNRPGGGAGARLVLRAGRTT
ncbi:MAG: hypothetical protein R2734_11415 [Nocardioides sp.]